MTTDLPIPSHFDPARVGAVWRVPYEARASEAAAWTKQHHLRPTAEDKLRICLVAVDVQNTFCIPDFELYVGGRSGTGAIDDNRRLCEFIYRNLGRITQIFPTLDTHQAAQIFHALFLVNASGEHPAPYSLIPTEAIESGIWRFNPALAGSLGVSADYGDRHLRHYARTLAQSGKYALTIWPYHAMLGGLGHALVAAVEEAIFFHSVARAAPVNFQIKGHHPFTENYSVLGPEVRHGPEGEVLVDRNVALIETLLRFDAVIITGQAKSHCVAWTIQDLLISIVDKDANLARKVYLLEDCTSPVVVPGAIDYTDEAEAAFRKFAEAGMHVVRSTAPMTTWPGILSAA